jgi:hypothetical protein
MRQIGWGRFGERCGCFYVATPERRTYCRDSHVMFCVAAFMAFSGVLAFQPAAFVLHQPPRSRTFAAESSFCESPASQKLGTITGR